jgi:hypothetical protein
MYARLPGEDAERVPGADGLGEGGEVRGDAVAALAAVEGDAEAGDDLRRTAGGRRAGW